MSGTKTTQACYICAKFKVACKGRKGPLYDSPGSGAKPSAPEELETVQKGPTDGEWESPKKPSAKKSEKRKFKPNLPTAQQIIQSSLVRDTGELPHKQRLAQPQLAPKSQPDRKGKKKGKMDDSDTLKR